MSPPTNQEIQEYILKEFKENYAKDSIKRKRREWSIASQVQSRDLSPEEIHPPTPLTPHQLLTLRTHFEGISPSTREIYAFISREFEIEYEPDFIRNKRSEWRISSKPRDVEREAATIILGLAAKPPQELQRKKSVFSTVTKFSI